MQQKSELYLDLEVLKSIEFEYANIQMLTNGIIKIEMFDGHIIDLEECVQITIAQGKLLGGKQGLMFMVADSTTQFTNSAREFSASKEGLRFSIAEALVIQNLAQKILVSFYLKINKPAKPSKAFNSEEDAIKWLLDYKK